MTRRMIALMVGGVLVVYAAVAVFSVGLGDPPVTDAPGGRLIGGDELTEEGLGVVRVNEGWTATIGDAVLPGLDADMVGSVIYRVASDQVGSAEGSESGAPSGCQGFPEITLQRTSEVPESFVEEIVLTLDYATCEIALSGLTSGSIEENPPGETWRLRGLAPRSSGYFASAVPVAFVPDRFVSSSTARIPVNVRYRYSTLAGEIRDAPGIALTHVDVDRKYRLSDLETVRFSEFCDTTTFFGMVWVPTWIRWFVDWCSGSHSIVDGRAEAWAQGRFHAEFPNPGAQLHGPNWHRTKVKLRGGTQSETRECTFYPVSVETLAATFPGIGTHEVRTRCRYSSRLEY